MKADLFRQLAALGLSTEQIAGVLEIMETEAEERKEKGRARWRKWKENQPTNVSKRLPTTANVNSQLVRVEDSSSNSKISENKKDNISHEFETEFWPAYPRKVGKGAALKAYAAARKRSSLEAIMAGVRRYAQERAGEDVQFTKHPQGWLSGDHWNDEPTPRRSATATGPPVQRQPRNVGELSRDQLIAPRTEIDVTDYSAGRVGASNGGRLPASAGDAEPFAVSGQLLGRI